MVQTPNGDEAKYADKSATYSKGLKRKSYGIVDPDAFKAFRAALGTSDGLTTGAMNFEDSNIILGGYSEQHTTPEFYTRLDGPAGELALSLGGGDAQVSGYSGKVKVTLTLLNGDQWTITNQ